MLTTQASVACENPRSDLIEGSATFTTVSSRKTMNCATANAAKAIQRRRAALLLVLVASELCIAPPSPPTHPGSGFTVLSRKAEPNTPLHRCQPEAERSTAGRRARGVCVVLRRADPA